jgi:hypothetical protein
MGYWAESVNCVLGPLFMQTRRKFIRDCSWVAALSTLVPATVLGENPVVRPPLSDPPGLAQFVRQLNTPFAVQMGSTTERLLLVKASTFFARRESAEGAGNERFSLLFCGPATSPLKQNTYWFEHAQMGRLSIFVVPVGRPNGTHCHYEAVFDRPVSTAEMARQIARAPRRAQTC